MRSNEKFFLLDKQTAERVLLVSLFKFFEAPTADLVLLQGFPVL
jgi:hypothetical protein